MKQSRSKTNVPVGTKFKYRNVWLEVIKGNSGGNCHKCYFKNHTFDTCMKIACREDQNVSKRFVYYKRIPTPNA